MSRSVFHNSEKCLFCDEELPYSALRVANSYANRKHMHRKCARKAQIKAYRIDAKRRTIAKAKGEV